jgi:alanine racemase
MKDGRLDRPGDERPCWLEVDLDAIVANVRCIRRLIGPDIQICAVVKADAYGLGALQVARAAMAGGAELLAVARVDEGVQLRQAGFEAPVLLLAGFAPTEADAIVKHHLIATVVEVEHALALGRAAGGRADRARVHVKVDTGLTRFGAPPEQAPSLVRLVNTLPSLELGGVYTHFAAADEVDRTFTEQQLGRFHAALQAIDGALSPAAVVHAANSAATLGEPSSRFDMVRLGITLSGHYPSEHVPQLPVLRGAVALRARALRVYDLPAGASVGYGRTYHVQRATRVALVPAGYADGVPRAHSNRADAVIRGVRVPLVGRVSMDQCVVDVSAVPDAAPGDEVTLFGPTTGDELPLHEYAAWSDTIVHEALCRIGPRVPRLYREGGRSWWGDSRASANVSAKRR